MAVPLPFGDKLGWLRLLCDANELKSNHPDKLKSILARRGAQWSFPGSITSSVIDEFADVLAEHIAGASEVWQAAYRGSDRLFYIIGDRVVVTQLSDEFESAWRATADQLAHYRTGTQIK